ncbi:thiamine phosphate synthase [Paenibacillus polygoni]|uniref:Thiamine phosphate synthase n=1 Tax=Paenibacillus polygoni TaxID=3050112 RepID=A0ABY8WXJ8_9BACL|nr:thiamine phosphate synthase [Paenibacillus polygoni]WIV17812.1 thiamine phosphate synthase [Paenibacillus polygoni]
MSKKMIEFHVISSPLKNHDLERSYFPEIWPYVTSLHLRKKENTYEEMEKLVLQLQELKIPANKLTLNRQTQLALTYQTGALHMGIQEAGLSLKTSFYREENGAAVTAKRALRCGISVHSLQEAKIAEEQGADYIFYGHMYPSHSKPGMPPKTLSSLQEICDVVKLPVIAIGGITPSRVEELMLSGASGIAAISGVLHSKDPLDAVYMYRNELAKYGDIKE